MAHAQQRAVRKIQSSMEADEGEMNRRSFLNQILKAAVGATILPPATTYARRWVRVRDVIVPETCGFITKVEFSHLTFEELNKMVFDLARARVIERANLDVAQQREFVDSFFFGKPI